MNLIKEFLSTDDCYRQGIGIIRTHSYGHSIAFFNELAQVAKTDFPQLNDQVLSVAHYSGHRYKGTYGIEFDVPNGVTLPIEYVEIKNVELTL